MPVATVYRSHRSITRPDGRYSICWTEFAWDAIPGEYRTSEADWFHRRSDPEPIAIRMPPGALPCADAEAAYRLAVAGEKGFRLEDDEMGRKRKDDGPGLFDAAAAEPPKLELRCSSSLCEDECCELPSCVHKDADRIDQLKDAIRRALEQHRIALDKGEEGRYSTARTILECALEG